MQFPLYVSFILSFSIAFVQRDDKAQKFNIQASLGSVYIFCIIKKQNNKEEVNAWNCYFEKLQKKISIKLNL